MTGRERIEAALSGVGSAECPAVICYEGLFLRDHWEQCTHLPWWYSVSADLEQQMAWRREALAALPQDWVYLPSGMGREQRERVRIVEHGRQVLRRDCVTGQAMVLDRPLVGGWTPGGAVASVHADHLPDSADELDDLLTEDTATSPADDSRHDLARLVLAEFGDRFPFRHVPSPLWWCYNWWGFEGLMTMAVDRPAVLAEACRRLLARAELMVAEAAAAGAAGIWIEECLTDLLSPRLYESLNLPWVRATAAAVKASGMRAVYYYCGDPTDRWSLLLEVGADALALEESKKGFAIDVEEALAQAAGRTAVLGNLDAVGVLQDGDDRRLADEVARQVAAGRRCGGRFVMSVGSPVTPGTPLTRVQRYLEMVHQAAEGASA